MSTKQINPGGLLGSPSDQEPNIPDRGITLRAILIGFLVIIPGVFWGVYGEVVSVTDMTSMSLMMPPVLILLTLLCINCLVGKVRREWALTRTELLTIYIMLTVSVILSGMGMIQFLCTSLGALQYYKAQYPEFNRLLHYVPSFIVPKPSSVQGFYLGDSTVPWGAWKLPIIFWSGFLFSMLFCMTCINAMLRKQWVERERLTFPIVQLPLEMTDPKTSFFSNKAMWIGFGLAAGVETLNSFSFLIPNIPHIQIRASDLAMNFPATPWKDIGYFPTTFYPLAIGLGFVLATDISFSCWFFYLLTKAENVITSALGSGNVPQSTFSSPPYLPQQGTGAFIGVVVVTLFIARRHLKDVVTKSFNPRADVDDSAEPMSYRTAFFGLIAGFGAMTGFCVLVGMKPIVAVAYLGIYLIFATTITRIRAEAGPAWAYGPDLTAMDGLIQTVGSSMFGVRNLVALGYFGWFSAEMRCCPMPSSIEGMKMAQTSRIRQRALTVIMLAAIVAGIAVGFWACLTVWYKFGASTAKVEQWRTYMGRMPFDNILKYTQNPKGADFHGMFAIFIGFAITLILSFLRSRFVWFPFHPIGYVLANTSTLHWLWCPFLIAWICKTLIIRYTGIKGYRAALPFFLGLVLGDYISSSLWALAGSILKIHMYRCFPC